MEQNKTFNLNHPLTKEEQDAFLSEVKDGDWINSINFPTPGSTVSWIWNEAVDRPSKLKEHGTK